MKYLQIKNDGLLEIALVALMGGTTKANDQYKLGQFGTGLKYTLAYLFRNNLDFSIYVGTEKVDISIEKETIREEEFEIICINGNRTSITTRMGLEWKGWWIIRELWSNALDEGNAVREIVEEVGGEEGKTTFCIQISPEIQEVLDNWEDYFIPQEEEPIFTSGNYRLYHPSKHLSLYKNGILIYRNKERKGVFNYDVKNASINEMREFTGAPSMEISAAIKKLDSDTISYFLDNVSNEHYEGNNMDYSWYTEWGESWKAFMMSTKIINENIAARYSSYGGGSYDRAHHTLVPKCLYNALVNSGESEWDDNLNIVEKEPEFYEVDATEIKDKIEMTIEKLIDLGYEFELGASIRYGFFNDNGRLIAVNPGKKRMSISIGIANMKETDLMKLLIEKCEQLKYDLKGDERTKQHFINLYMKQLEVGNTVEI